MFAMRNRQNQKRVGFWWHTEMCQWHRIFVTLSKLDMTTVEFFQSIFPFVFLNFCCQMQQNGHRLLTQNRYTKFVRKQPFLSAVDKIQKMFNSSVRKERAVGRGHFIQLPRYSKSYCCENIFWMSFKVLIWLLLTWFMLPDLLRIQLTFISIRFNKT